MASAATNNVRVKIPDDVTYHVNSHKFNNDRRIFLNVILTRKVTKYVLRSISLKLKKTTPDVVSVSYTLSQIPTLDGIWAVADFKPELDLKIYGVSVEQEKELKSEHDNAHRNIIGRWLSEAIGTGYEITIFRYLKDNKIYLKTNYPETNDFKGKSDYDDEKNGLTNHKTCYLRGETDCVTYSIKEVIERNSQLGRLFVGTENFTGLNNKNCHHYYLINAMGNLMIGDTCDSNKIGDNIGNIAIKESHAG